MMAYMNMNKLLYACDEDALSADFLYIVSSQLMSNYVPNTCTLPFYGYFVSFS